MQYDIRKQTSVLLGIIKWGVFVKIYQPIKYGLVHTYCTFYTISYQL